MRTLILFILAGAAYAQQFRGTISGRVTDQQAAVIANAAIVATQVETGSRTQTVSTADGQYTLPFLPPGDYSVSAEFSGFKRFVREGLRMSANERVSLDIQMDIGQTADAITVSGESPLLVTSTASVGQVINQRQIENMPMNGRTPLVLAQLAFGVIPNSDPRFYRPFDDGGPSGFSMGGAPNRQNEGRTTRK